MQTTAGAVLVTVNKSLTETVNKRERRMARRFDRKGRVNGKAKSFAQARKENPRPFGRDADLYRRHLTRHQRGTKSPLAKGAAY